MSVARGSVYTRSEVTAVRNTGEEKPSASDRLSRINTINRLGENVLKFGYELEQHKQEEVLAVPERDTVSQVITASEKLDAGIASLTNATKEKVSSGHVETLGKEPPS